MKTFHKLLLVGMGIVLVLGLGLLLTVRQLRSTARAVDLLSRTQSLRAEVLLTAAYASDLVTARQRNDALVEQESIRLLNRTVARATELLGQMQEDDGGLADPDTGRDVREVMDLWQLSGDAAESMIAGRAVMRNLDFLRDSSVRLAHRLTPIVAAAARRRETGARAALWTLLWVCLVQAGLVGLALWRLQVDIFAGMDSTLESMQLLGSGTLSPEATLPEQGRGEFRQMTRTLNRFLERIRESDRTKDRFLAAMSHEIRTPMNGVIGFLGNLRETPLNEQQRQYVRVIESSARSLLRVLNEILDFSKLAAGRMELEEVAFDLPRLAEDCVAMARQLVRSKPVKVVFESTGLEAGVIRGDPTRLRQILDNLLGNAAKFTERGEIRLRIEAVSRPEERLELRLAVSDTGIGIPPDRQRDLFKPFTQVEAGTTRKYGGTGLGLCIAASLTDLMGGRLSAESRPGEGSTFHFTFVSRFARSEEQVQLSGHYRIILPPGALRKFWALLVDDTPTNLFLMETICQSIGLPYRTATNGKEAVELAQEQKFDLIFMDIQMPIMDGYTAIREIRKLDHSGGTQIIALTASAFQEDVDKALGAGSTGFLAKPFERDHLLLCIAQHLDVPVDRELREPLEAHDTREGMLVRQMYDFMREQYQISLGEIKMILAQSVSDWRPLLDDLRVFGRRADWDEVRTIMHRLKGQLASIGLPSFAERAGSFTAAIRAGQTETLRGEIETFTAELSAVFLAVEQEVTVMTAGVAKSPPSRPAALVQPS
jgi:signal transduction histidine kinase/CheY-like chemotaxis protein/HPt (histidine-containing phosphotransfer) domain-containing protein